MPQAPRSHTGWLSHAAAVLVGVSLMAVSRGCQDSDQGAAGDATTATVEVRGQEADQFADGRTQEISSQRPVTEVVERIVKVRVEVPVEKVVERIVYRDRPVMHALQPRIDAQLRAANLLSEAALTGIRLADRVYTRLEERRDATPAPMRLAEPKVVASAAPKPESGSDAAARQRPMRAHLEVRRVGGRVSLRTRGSLEEVVPVLIDTLESEDGAVVAAAVDRLESIRADLGARAVTLRPEEPPPGRRSGLRALLSSRATAIRASELDDLTLWRDWWSRQQATDAKYRATASI